MGGEVAGGEAEKRMMFQMFQKDHKETTMNQFRWLIVCVAVSVGLAAWAEEKVELKINYEPGDYVMMSSMTMKMAMTIDGRTYNMRTRVATATDMTVGKADADGNREVTFTYRHIKTDATQDGRAIMAYDSASDDDPQHPAGKTYAAMIGKTITVTVDSKGGCKAQGVDEIAEAALKEFTI